MSGRHRAREAALQALYFWEVGRAPLDEALAIVFAEHLADASEAVRRFAEAIVRGTVADLASVDRVIEEHSAHWRLERLAVIDRLILRMAIWELRHEPDTAPAVVLDEAIELARAFGTEDSARFVNGVLDAVRKTLEGPSPGP
jgi:N utilization substance protein B